MTDERPKTLLLLLQRHFAREWTIRRNGGLWVATARDPECTHAPTLIEEDVETFTHQLMHPPSGIGRTPELEGQLKERGFSTGSRSPDHETRAGGFGSEKI